LAPKILVHIRGGLHLRTGGKTKKPGTLVGSLWHEKNSQNRQRRRTEAKKKECGGEYRETPVPPHKQVPYYSLKAKEEEQGTYCASPRGWHPGPVGCEK